VVRIQDFPGAKRGPGIQVLPGRNTMEHMTKMYPKAGTAGQLTQWITTVKVLVDGQLVALELSACGAPALVLNDGKIPVRIRWPRHS
jgi:hypothetical protein